MMETIGALLERVAPGEVDIRVPFREALSQHHGFLHAGAITTAVDTACGYAALTLMPAGAGVLTIEFKVNLLSPGKGEAIVARGRVVKPGRTVVVLRGRRLRDPGRRREARRDDDRDDDDRARAPGHRGLSAAPQARPPRSRERTRRGGRRA